MQGFLAFRKRTVLLVGILPILYSFPSWAVEQVYIGEKHIMPKAVKLAITPRGQKYFETRLSNVLGNLGVNFEEGYFPTQRIAADKDIDLDELERKQPEAVRMFKQVRTLLTQYLTGFALDNHRPAVEIGDSGYIAKFKKFGLLTDQALMDSLGKREGAVLAVELEITKLKIDSSYVKAWDLNNEFLGQVGLEGVQIEAGSDEQPLKLRLPFYVRIDSQNRLEFTALKVEQNVDLAPVDLNYKNLIIPKVGVIINDKTYYLNNEEVEKYLRSQLPTILLEVRKHIKQFAETQLPDLLNKKAKEQLQGALEQVQDMEAPGTEPGDRRPMLKWGLILKQMDLKNSLNIQLDAYVEDPVNPRSTLVASHAAKGEVQFNSMPAQQYDIALSIDRALINRVMNLSFQRKNFENIKTCDGTQLRLVETPVMDYAAPPANAPKNNKESYMKLKLAVEADPGTMFLKDKVVVTFDLLTKLRQRAQKDGIELVMHSIDLDTVYLDPKYYSFLGSLFKNKVLAEVKKTLSQGTQSCGNNAESMIPGSLPLPPEILGLKLDINKLQVDPSGHLVMYLNYQGT
ncbi:MAG: hypothetical protein ACLGGX_09530 [Bdellovibrionia bacterium]